jgi:WD40 repeat protein
MALDSHPSTDEVLITRAAGLVQCSADGSGPARTVQATGRLTTACFTPTYGRVLAANEQGQAMLINLTTGQPERITQLAVCREDPTNPFAKNTARINCLRHSHDEDWAVAGLADFTVRVFYPETCCPGNELQGHTTPLLSVAISRDKRWILSGAQSVPYKRAAYGIDGRTLRLWDRISGQCVRVFDHKLAVLGAYLGDDGQWGLTLSEDGLCRLWSMRTGRCVRTFGRPVERSGALAVTPDGQHAAVLCDDIADVWKVGGPSPRRAAVAAALPHDVGELSRHAAQLDEALSSGQRLMEQGRPGDVLGVVGQARALKGYERHPGLIKLWRRAGRYARRSGLRGGWLTRTYDTGATVSAVGLDPTGTTGISGATAFMDAYNAVSVWDLATGERRRIWSGHTKPLTRIATSIDGQWIISTSRDGTARGWRQGRCDGIARHTKPVLVAGMHPTNLHVMTGGEFSQVRLWALPGMTYPMQFPLPDGADRCRALACGPDGRWAVVAIGSGLYVLDISSKRWQGPVATGLSEVTDLSVNPLGRVLAGGEDGACEVWDLGPPRKVGGFSGHGDEVTSAVLTADGLWAITGSRDGTVRLWDVTGGQCLRTFEGHTGPVLAVALDVRERRVLSGGEDKTLRLWELDWEYTFEGFADQCDAVADAIIEDFLVLHCQRAGGGMDITGRPVYRPDEIKYLLKQMQRCGLGHIHPEAVKQRVDDVAGSWSKPPACRAMRS